MSDKTNRGVINRVAFLMVLATVFAVNVVKAWSFPCVVNDGTEELLMLDHDNDGIPSEYENYNGNDSLEDDDTDGDGIPNYLDPDDDNDGIETREELTQKWVLLAGGNTDNDVIPNYLDPDDDNDGILTINEVKDSDNNGIPDYIEYNKTIKTINDVIEPVVGIQMAINTEVKK